VALGTGPERLQSYIENNWAKQRTGRADVPPIIKHATGSDNPDLNTGVLVVRDRSQIFVDNAKHDLIHLYHPEAAAPVIEDNGYAEQRIVEQVQADIVLTNRPDPNDSGVRLSAKDRIRGSRDNVADFDSAPYPGIWGETRYILETIRRGLDEWDRVKQDPINVVLKSSDAKVSINIELEQIATNTVQ